MTSARRPQAARHGAPPLRRAFWRHVRSHSRRPHRRGASRAKRFHLDAIYFVPSSRPPHKTKLALTPFVHRYAMVGAGLRGSPDFRPSLAEAQVDGAAPHVFYTIDTVRRFRREHPDDHLYFIVGADQFLEIPTWKNYETLLDSCDFIIASRPGFRLERFAPGDSARKAGPREIRRTRTRSCCASRSVHLLTTVSSHVSSTEIRERLGKQKKHPRACARARGGIHSRAGSVPVTIELSSSRNSLGRRSGSGQAGPRYYRPESFRRGRVRRIFSALFRP